MATKGQGLDSIPHGGVLDRTLPHPGRLPPPASPRLPWSAAVLVIGALSLLAWGAVALLVRTLLG